MKYIKGIKVAVRYMELISILLNEFEEGVQTNKKQFEKKVNFIFLGKLLISITQCLSRPQFRQKLYFFLELNIVWEDPFWGTPENTLTTHRTSTLAVEQEKLDCRKKTER